MKKCIYCSVGIDADFVVDMCRKCMYQVWGEKMANAIVKGMEDERKKGNLNLGEIGNAECGSEKIGESFIELNKASEGRELFDFRIKEDRSALD